MAWCRLSLILARLAVFLVVFAWVVEPLGADIQIVRAEEDWTIHPTSPPGKAIRLGPRSFLTLGGEWRLALEHFDEESWGDIPGSDGFLMNRLMAHASWTFKPEGRWLDQARIFLQLKHGEVYERQSEDRPPDIDRLDWNAAFLELRHRSSSGQRYTLRLGRQELHYGAARLLSVREGPNTRTAFDAALLRFENERWRADLFYAFPNETDAGTFDNGRRAGRKLRGLYATRDLLNSVPGSDRGIDIYVFVDERPQGYYQSSGFDSGREERSSVGGRYFHRGQRWHQDILWTWQSGTWQPGTWQSGTWQRGDFESGVAQRRIRAWTFSSNTNYKLSTSSLQPTLNLFLGYTTGDQDPNDLTVETFRAPFPPGRYFGSGMPNGPMNVVFYRLGLAFRPRQNLTLDIGMFDFWRQSRADGTYGVPGVPLRSPGTSDERHTGRLFEIKAAFPWHRHVEIEAEAAYFIAGSFLDGSPPVENTSFLGLKAVLKY